MVYHATRQRGRSTRGTELRDTDCGFRLNASGYTVTRLSGFKRLAMLNVPVSVIVQLSLPAEQFQLGRVLSVEGDTTVTLETTVPLGDRTIPLVRLHEPENEAFERHVRGHPAVDDLRVVNTHDDETLYGLESRIDDDFFQGVLSLDGNLLEATGTADTWSFDLRFPSHAALSDFQKYCHDADLRVDIKRIYNPTRPDAGPWYGLTTAQREMLIEAVEVGYYSLPRRISTQALADTYDISDQAVTERLRRGIDTLVTNTLLLTNDD